MARTAGRIELVSKHDVDAALLATIRRGLTPGFAAPLSNGVGEGLRSGQVCWEPSGRECIGE